MRDNSTNGNHTPNRRKNVLKDTLEIPSLWKVFSDISPLRRFFWIVIFLTCFVLFLYETSNRVHKLAHPSKSATVNLEYEDILEFPSVTICPGYQFRASVLRAQEPSDRYGCKPGVKYCSWISPWNMATHTEMIMKNCTFQKKNCSPGQEQLGKWSRRLTSLGRCFTYNPNATVQNGGESNALEVTVDPMLWDRYGLAIFNGIRVYIHNASDIPLVEITGLNINQGSSAHFSLQVKDYFRVSDANVPCTTDPNDNESRCTLRCIYLTSMLLSNNTCGAPFMQEFKTKVCRTRKEIAFFNENFQKLIYNGSIWNKCVDGCPKPCKQRIFKPITTSLGFGATDPTVTVTIYFGNMWVERIVEDWDYNFDEFIVDMGGSLNLFLGASCYTIIQIFDLAIEYLKRLIRRWILRISTERVADDDSTKIAQPIKITVKPTF